MGSIPLCGTKIPHGAAKKKKEKVRCPPQAPTMFRTWKEVLGPRKSARHNHSGPPGADLMPARGADSEAFNKDSKFLLSFIEVFIEDLLCARLGYSSDYNG